jgi:hypothetical protein
MLKRSDNLMALIFGFRTGKVSGVRCQDEHRSVRKSDLVETPYFNVKASEITLIIADT